MALARCSRSEPVTVAVGFSPRLNVVGNVVAERRVNERRDMMEFSSVAPRRNPV